MNEANTMQQSVNVSSQDFPDLAKKLDPANDGNFVSDDGRQRQAVDQCLI